jgi:hypothetical protein
LNKSFATAGIKHIRNFIQHASENHNPDKLSPLDATFVHVWHNQLSMTKNENEVIEFVLQKDYLAENIFNVHHRWDIHKWSRVVEAQLDRQQPVLAETIAAFKAHRNKSQSFSNILKWVKNPNDKR